MSALAPWLLPIGAGAVLRLWNLDRQILLDDEMHTVSTALYLPMREILSSWKSEDPCLPLTALYRAMLESGMKFSEMTFRAPVVIASLLAIVLLPMLARPLVGRRTALLFAWMLAVSPVLAIYAGMIRPYGVIALLAPTAMFAVLRWRASGRLGWGLAYAVLAPLCLWFHLATAPFLAAPFGLLVVETLWARLRAPRTRHRGEGDASAVADGRSPSALGPSIRDFVIVAAASLALVAAFMVPTWRSLQTLVATKSGIARFSFELVAPIARLQAGATMGTAAIVMTIAFWAAAALGVVTLARRNPSLLVYAIAATLAQWVGLAILKPIGLLNPIIFNRYLIGTLPLVLLLVAVGLDRLAELASRRRAELSPRAWLGLAVPASAIALLLATGPFADGVFRRSSFQHSKDFIRFDLPRGVLAATAIPPFYTDPAVRAAAEPIIEFPFRGGWSCTRTHYVYQTIHRARVVAAEPFGWPCDERLRLRNHVCPRPAVFLRFPARYLVVHRDPLAEESAMVGGDDTGDRYNPQEWVEFAQTAGRMTRGLRRRFGPAAYRDDRITVWDLDEVRRRVKEGTRAPR